MKQPTAVKFCAGGAGCLRRPILFCLARNSNVQPLFLCVAKKKPLAVKRKRQRGSCVGTNSTSLILSAACGGQASSVPLFLLFPHESLRWIRVGALPLCKPLKTTKEEVIPLPWNHHPSEYRRWRKCSRRNRNYTFVGADAHIGPYESQKIAHPANSIRQIFSGRKQSDLYGVSCARETRSYGRPKGVQTTETKR